MLECELKSPLRENPIGTREFNSRPLGLIVGSEDWLHSISIEAKLPVNSDVYLVLHIGDHECKCGVIVNSLH